ncbi:MAG: helix-turn-helix domain-containing protein [Candidatus Bathyanammoxibius sp.]
MKRLLLGTKEASEYLGISINTLYAWTSQKRISHIKVGRLVKFDLEDLNQYITSNTIAKNSDWPVKSGNN